jgi:hypothetical protein
VVKLMFVTEQTGCGSRGQCSAVRATSGTDSELALAGNPHPELIEKARDCPE